MISKDLSFTEHARLVEERYGPAPTELMHMVLEDSLLSELLELIDGNPQDFDEETPLFPVEDLLVDQHSSYTEEKLLSNTIPHDLYPGGRFPRVLRKLHEVIRANFQSVIGSPFVFVNTRAWTTRPNTERFGPNAMHLDGFEPGHLKVLVYLTPLNEESGYLEIEGGRVIGLPAGSCVLFRNSDVLHSGVSGTSKPRISMEVAIMRAFIDAPQMWIGEHYGRHLVSPGIAYERLESTMEAPASDSEGIAPHPEHLLKINIGSGRRDWPDWTCFDEIEHPGVTNIVLSEHVSFPIENESVGLAYSSHNFEHLPDNTIYRIIWELRRVLSVNGVFVLKIPDYDWFLEQYRENNPACMNEKGIEPITYTWASKGLEDNFLNRLAMMFCGYWNKQYGDHFSGRVSNHKAAYHGPAVMSPEFIEHLFRNCTPYEITRTMTKVALCDQDFIRFNHQNAWSREEMTNLFQEFGFRLETTDRQTIIDHYEHLIPDLHNMEDWSAYYLFRQVEA